MMPKPPARAGFTLIELLAVTAVIGVLLCLILPAVAASREAARKVECSNRLKQIGLGLHGYRASHSTFPAILPARFTFAGSAWSDPDGISIYYDLLPHLDHAPIYNSINLGSMPLTATSRLGPFGPQNSTASSLTIALLLCPSDSFVTGRDIGPNSFRFNVGCSNPYPGSTPGPRGPFEPGVAVAESGIPDGLSSTAGMSERLVGRGNPTDFDRVRDFWWSGILGIGGSLTDDSITTTCRAATRSPRNFYSRMGRTWATGTASTIWYNHVAPPAPIPSDCALSEPSNGNAPDSSQFYSVAASSGHDSGVNVLMMDGGVRFVRHGINPSTWHALGTRAGSEVIGSVD